MKKVILGLVIGVAIALPVGTFAWGNLEPPHPKPIYQFNCGHSGHNCYNEISVFDDSGNKCYVTYDLTGGASAISCVGQGK